MQCTPNPLCGCGCGYEVARPWNRYIHGHYSKRGVRKISIEDVIAIRKARRKGVSGYKLARLYDVSPAWIYVVTEFGVKQHVSEYARSILRREDLDEIAKRVEERNSWRKAKKAIKEVRSLLRDPQKLQSAESRQAQISQP